MLSRIIRSAILLAVLSATCAWAGETSQTSSSLSATTIENAFKGVVKASIEHTPGAPRLIVNGEQVLPFIFFFNTGQNKNYQERFQTPQVKMSASAGVHIYSTVFGSASDYGTNPYAQINSMMDSFIKVDPQAVFIPRLYTGMDPGAKKWNEIPEGDKVVYPTSSTPEKHSLSLGSDYFWGPSNERLAQGIQHYEKSPLGKRMLAYHIGSENFQRDTGPDISPAAMKRFRQWLKVQYKNDETLRQAWGNSTVTLATAELSKPEKGRFPIHSIGNRKMIQVFYDLPREQDWVDYSHFFSELMADRIIDWAHLVKRETQGKKLNVAFYGYTYEMFCGYSGHDALGRVLDDPDVDILVSPVPYFGRVTGEPGPFMSPVDSITAHGKLWLNEDDIRTHLITDENTPSWLHDAMFGQRAKDQHESLNLLERNFAALFAHRAGTWWMDLAGGGQFQDQALWDMLKERMRMYGNPIKKFPPYRPEVALLIDERSKAYIKNDWDTFYWGQIMLRNACGKTGAAIGYYLLDDFINGIVPPCKAYVFVDTYHLSDAQMNAIRKRLDREGSTAFWIFAPGVIGSRGLEVQRATRLTGIDLSIQNGTQGSQGIGLLKGENWGAFDDITQGFLSTSPRLTVVDDKAESLGRYTKDNLVSTARKKVGRSQSVFLGDLGINWQVLTKLFADAGVHIWVHDGSIIQTDGKFLMVHTATPGLKAIDLPQGVTAESIKGKIEKTEGNRIFVNFARADSLWFKLD